MSFINGRFTTLPISPFKNEKISPGHEAINHRLKNYPGNETDAKKAYSNNSQKNNGVRTMRQSKVTKIAEAKSSFV